MRLMYDSVNASAIPADAQMVAGYVSPSGFTWSSASWARFPTAVKVKITPQVSHTGLGIHVLDVEKGDATAAQAPGWARAQRALGQDPTVYCSSSIWGAVQAAFRAAGEAQPHYWIAAYPGTGQNLPTLNGLTAVAHQYSDPGPYDLSVVADYWPGVDNLMAVLGTDDLANIASEVWKARIPFPTAANPSGDAPAQDVLRYADVYAGQAATAVQDPTNGLAALGAAVHGQSVTLSTDQLTALEQTIGKAVSSAVAGLNLSVSAADQAAIAQAVAAELGAKLSA